MGRWWISLVVGAVLLAIVMIAVDAGSEAPDRPASPGADEVSGPDQPLLRGAAQLNAESAGNTKDTPVSKTDGPRVGKRVLVRGKLVEVKPAGEPVPDREVEIETAKQARVTIKLVRKR